MKGIKPFAFKKLNDSTTELNIFGDITSWEWLESDVSSHGFKAELDAVDTTDLIVNINSYGGEVAEGLAIYNALKDFNGKVITKVDGFACSIASVIFMAGQERIMQKSSLLMIHNAWSYASGNANDLEKAAEDLRKINESIIESYLACSNLSKEKIQELLDNETWLTPEEALDYGFATKVNNDDGAKNSMEQHHIKALINKIKVLESDKAPEKTLNNFMEDYLKI